MLESREAYDIRPFVTGFGDTPGEAVTVYFGTTADAFHQSYPTTVGADVRRARCLPMRPWRPAPRPAPSPM